MALTSNAMEAARLHGGCLTRGQLIAAGVGERTIDRMVSDGRIQRAASGVYRLMRSSGWLDDVRAAALALPGAVVSHHAAAALHDLPRVKALPTVTVHTRTTHTFPGVQVRRAHDVAIHHIVEMSGLWCTTVARTVFDLAGLLHTRHVEDIIQDLVIARRLEVGDLERLVSELARRGKPGITSLRRALERLGTDSLPPTELERRGWDALVTGGICDGQREHSIPWDPRRRFDLAWPDARLAIEWDSRRWHGALEQMEFDRRRDRTAAVHGWIVLRYTWDDVTIRPEQVVADTRRLLMRRRSA